VVEFLEDQVDTNLKKGETKIACIKQNSYCYANHGVSNYNIIVFAVAVLVQTWIPS
jgi:hypothetical protein